MEWGWKTIRKTWVRILPQQPKRIDFGHFLNSSFFLWKIYVSTLPQRVEVKIKGNMVFAVPGTEYMALLYQLRCAAPRAAAAFGVCVDGAP